jgi:hypothetical protein
MGRSQQQTRFILGISRGWSAGLVAVGLWLGGNGLGGSEVAIAQTNARANVQADAGASAEAEVDVEANAEADNPVPTMQQVTAVTQLSDVQPSDWAYQALQALVERYGCIVGYPDRRFLGNRALSRYEFAAGLNACLDRVRTLLDATQNDFARQADLADLKTLVEAFAPELSLVRSRVDVLEVRQETLQRQAFSTTTKLFGQAIVGVQGRTSPALQQRGVAVETNSSEIAVISNIELSLYTAFDPRSVLLTSLQAGSGSTGGQPLTNNTRLGYEQDSGQRLELKEISFRHLLTNRFAVIAGAQGISMASVFRGANRIESAGQGPLSFLAQRNPVLNLGTQSGLGTEAGVGLDWQLGTRVSLQGVYFANRPNQPGDGLWGGENGGTTVGAQVAIAPSNQLDIALYYAHSYSPSGVLGLGSGDDQVALPLNPGPTLRAPVQTNALGGTVAWRIIPQLTLGGWAGLTHSQLQGFAGSVTTVNWMAFLNLPDLGGKGNLAGVYIGQPPAITQSDLPAGRNVPSLLNGGNLAAVSGGQRDRTLHLEVFYRWRLSDTISITPGLVLILNPNHNAANDPITLGVVRSTFTF